MFLAAPGDRYGRLKGFMSTSAEIALSALLSLDPEGERCLWMVLDDPAALHRLPGLVPALTDARRLGVHFLIGIGAVGPLRALHGADGAATISGLCGTRVATMAADGETAEWSSANLAGGGRTVAWPWEIDRLPYGHGYVSFPGGDPATKFELDEARRSGGKQWRAAANRFIPADGAETFMAEPPAENVPDAPGGQRAGPAESHARPSPNAGRKKSRHQASRRAASSQARTPKAAPETKARNTAGTPPETAADKGDGNAGTPTPGERERRKRKYGRWI